MMRSTASPELNYDPDRQWYGETEAGIQQYYETLSEGQYSNHVKAPNMDSKGCIHRSY
jgi:hypothetical protein